MYKQVYTLLNNFFIHVGVHACSLAETERDGRHGGRGEKAAVVAGFIG